MQRHCTQAYLPLFYEHLKLHVKLFNAPVHVPQLCVIKLSAHFQNSCYYIQKHTYVCICICKQIYACTSRLPLYAMPFAIVFLFTNEIHKHAVVKQNVKFAIYFLCSEKLFCLLPKVVQKVSGLYCSSFEKCWKLLFGNSKFTIHNSIIGTNR